MTVSQAHMSWCPCLRVMSSNCIQDNLEISEHFISGASLSTSPSCTCPIPPFSLPNTGLCPHPPSLLRSSISPLLPPFCLPHPASTTSQTSHTQKGEAYRGEAGEKQSLISFQVPRLLPPPSYISPPVSSPSFQPSPQETKRTWRETTAITSPVHSSR